MQATIIIFLVLCIGQAFAQDLANTLLWRIVPQGGGEASYVYGTFHTKDDRAFQFSDSVLPCMARCKSVVGELDLKKERQNAMAMLEMMRLPNEQKLEDIYKKKEYKIIKAKMDAKFGSMAAMLQRMKPIWVLFSLSEGEIDGEHLEFVDEYFQTQATNNNQTVLGIETIEEQMEALNSVPLNEQARLLLDLCKEKEPANEFELLIDAYEKQDLNEIYDLMNKATGAARMLEKAIIIDRNMLMVHRMDSLIQQDTTCFFLLGAAHLPGTTGVIKGLADRGYSVSPVLGVAKREEQLVAPDR